MSDDERMDPADMAKWDAAEEGMELLRTGEHEEAKKALLAVIEADPTNEYAQLFLGHAFFELQDFSRSLKCYVATLDISPRHIGAMIGAGQSLRFLGDHQRALRMGQQVLRIEKDDPDALFLVGATHFQRGELEEARPFLERFLHTNPEIEVALEVEGMLQVIRGDAMNEADLN